jgi:CheY-like chemotaxis protein
VIAFSDLAEPGSGLTFTVDSAKMGLSNRVQTTRAGEGKAVHETTTWPRILCVEDEAGMLDLLRLILETAGYGFLSAGDGLEGLEAMRREQPDLVLLDLMLPKLDGAGVLLHKKTDPRIKEIPVIAVTALASPFDQLMWKRHTEIREYVTKPFTRKDLLESIERVLTPESACSGSGA